MEISKLSGQIDTARQTDTKINLSNQRTGIADANLNSAQIQTNSNQKKRVSKKKV